MKRLIPLFIVLCLLVSCGTRKTQKSNLDMVTKTNSEFATNDTTNVKTNIDTNTKTTTTTEAEAGTGAVIETITDEPIDPTKPSSVTDDKGNKTELNNAKRTRQKKTLQRDEKSKTVSNIQIEQKAAQDSVKRTETSGKSASESELHKNDKITTREATDINLWWLLLIIPIGAIIYIIKRKTPLI